MNFENHTKYPAGWTMGFESDGREMLILVVKATFRIPNADGVVEQADEQVPLVEADEFYGEPGYSATLYESDFAPRKLKCDVLINGHAHAPGGRPIERVTVALQVGAMKKSFDVFGDRRWDRFMMKDTPTMPMPFTRKTISYGAAFGGADTEISGRRMTKTYASNPVGVGYYPFSNGQHLEGNPLPNTEETGKPIKASKTGNFRPMSFGPLGRNFRQRARLAGTYDQAWMDQRAPFWPADFDTRYFQAAPPEQCIRYPKGGEPVILTNLTPEGTTAFALPRFEIPVLLSLYQDSDKHLIPAVDTIVIEPDRGIITMTGRISLPLRRNCFEIKDVIIGERKKAWAKKPIPGSEPEDDGWPESVGTGKMVRR